MSFRRRVLAAVTTFGSPAYVDLSLTKLQSFGIPCAVFDDGSESKELLDVCNKHGVYLHGLYKRRQEATTEHKASRIHSTGDVISTADAMTYADAHGYDFMLKISRSWICLEDPIPSLEQLYKESGGSTFGSYTTTWGMGFRTEFIAYNLQYWREFIHEIGVNGLHDNGVGLVEAFMHGYARKLQPESEKYKKYMENQKQVPGADRYVHWAYMGTDKCHNPSSVLWHDSNRPAEYVKACRDCGLNQYTEEDFRHTGPVEELMHRR